MKGFKKYKLEEYDDPTLYDVERNTNYQMIYVL